MKKYEVKVSSVETKDGRNAYEKFLNQGNQDMDIVASCDSLEEAMEIYDDIPTSYGYHRNGNTKYYLHDFKVIDEVEYDSEGEYVVSYGWQAYELPEKGEDE